MSRTKRFLLDLFFPNTCCICGKLIDWDLFICDECVSRLEFADERVCKNCGKAECICKEKLPYQRAETIFFYHGETAEKIRLFKVSPQMKNFGRYIGEKLSEKILEDVPDLKFDFVIPVPESKESLKKKGFNQSEIIAKQIAENLNCKVRTDLIVKNSGVRQHDLKTAKERKINVETLFSLSNNENLTGKNIIICDDIITTGSTLKKCASLIKSLNPGYIMIAIGATAVFKELLENDAEKK